MKKVLASLVLLTYFTVSTGFVVSLHYCMDRFNSAELGHSSSSHCTKCGMHKSEGCCHDDVKMVKLPLSHTAAQALLFSLQAPVSDADLFTSFQPVAAATANPVITPRQGAPPGQPPAYLRHRVFRL